MLSITAWFSSMRDELKPTLIDKEHDNHMSCESVSLFPPFTVSGVSLLDVDRRHIPAECMLPRKILGSGSTVQILERPDPKHLTLQHLDSSNRPNAFTSISPSTTGFTSSLNPG